MDQGSKCAFYEFVHSPELKRRRQDKRLEQREYHHALYNFLNNLFSKINSFEIAVRKRLMKIKYFEIYLDKLPFNWSNSAPRFKLRGIQF
jgi:hypothetical protein